MQSCLLTSRVPKDTDCSFKLELMVSSPVLCLSVTTHATNCFWLNLKNVHPFINPVLHSSFSATGIWWWDGCHWGCPLFVIHPIFPFFIYHLCIFFLFPSFRVYTLFVRCGMDMALLWFGVSPKTICYQMKSKKEKSIYKKGKSFYRHAPTLTSFFNNKYKENVLQTILWCLIVW